MNRKNQIIFNEETGAIGTVVATTLGASLAKTIRDRDMSINVNEEINDSNMFRDNEKTNESKVKTNNDKCIDIYIKGNKVNGFPEFKSLLHPEFISKPSRDTGYASQGLCHAGGDVLITSYKSGEPSKLDITNELGQSKVLKLDVPNGAHVGGVAYHEESGNVYIPASNTKLFVYTSKSIENASNGDTLKRSAEIDLTKLKDRPDAVSFVTVHDNALYVGAFHQDGGGFTKEYPAKPEILKYELNDDGTVNTNVAPVKYNIPDKVQGFDIVERNGKEYFVFSTSYGRNNDSKLLICTPDEDGTMQTLKTIKLPCMAEEVSVNEDGKLGIVFESDCTKFDQWYDSPNMQIGNVLYIDIDKVINQFDKTIKIEDPTLTLGGFDSNHYDGFDMV